MTTATGSSVRQGEVSFFVAMVATIAAIGGGLFGYDTGVISGAILYIKKEFPIDDATEGLVVSAVTAGALVSAMVAGVLADRGGRRLTNIAAGIVFAVASLLCAVANSVSTLIAGRFLVGCGIGLTSVGGPMYIAEASPARIRGTFVSLFQLAVTVGILLAYIAAALLAPSAAWRWMLGLAAIPGLLLAVGMFFMPESPRWLVKQGRRVDARAVLTQIDPHGNPDAALAQLEHDLAAEGQGTWADLLRRTLRPALIVGIGLAVFQQVTGINAVIYYAPQIFQAAGFTSDLTSLAATTGIGTINVLATFIAIWLVDRAGRRPLLIAGVLGMVTTLTVLGLAFRDAGSGTAGSLGLITAVCLAAYIVFFAFSLGPIVWLMISEIYPLRNRAQAVAVSTAANWGANFLVSLTFPILTNRLGSSHTFFIYAALGVVTLIFVIARVPETKGKTLEEISALWR
ncbi:MAG TPA: sugar porter family MFS transporter [Candidatus Binatia bacterium]|nr:sugar porter family MFS transporter [Candidatus Binatia bacterium]